MKKEKLSKYWVNFLRFLTRGQIPDKILEQSFDYRLKGNKFVFKFKAKIKTKDWRWIYGTSTPSTTKI